MACPCPTCGQTLPDDPALRVDPAGIIVRNGRFATLTAQEFGVFEQLHAANGAVKTKETLLAGLYWHEQDAAEIRIIDALICKMRKKLKGLGVEIGTVWGQGYRLVRKAGS